MVGMLYAVLFNRCITNFHVLTFVVVKLHEPCIGTVCYSTNSVRIWSCSVDNFEYSLISSANILLRPSITSGLSFTSMRKRMSPNTLPWGTPLFFQNILLKQHKQYS